MFNFEGLFNSIFFNSKYPNINSLIFEISSVLITVFEDRISDVIVSHKLHCDTSFGIITENGRGFTNPFQYYSAPIEDYFGECGGDMNMIGSGADGGNVSELWNTSKRFLDQIQFRSSYKETILELINPFIQSGNFKFTYRCCTIFFLSLCKSWMNPQNLDKDKYVERYKFYNDIIRALCNEIVCYILSVQLKEYDNYPPSGKEFTIDDLKYDILCKLDDTICDPLYALKDGTEVYPLDEGLSGGLYDYFVEETYKKSKDFGVINNGSVILPKPLF